MSGPVIVAPIHISMADPPAVACASPRHFCFMAKEELFRGWFGKLIFSVGSFPVRRDGNDSEAVRKAIAILQRGDALVLFPEGVRGAGVHLGELNKGVALLAKKTGAWVVPVGVSGTEKLLAKGGAKLKRSKTRVVFGKPFKFEDVSPDGGKVDATMFSAYLADRLIALSAEAGLPLQLPLSSPKSED